MAALGLAPQSMLGCLGSFALVSNSFFASLILKERHCGKSAFATVREAKDFFNFFVRR
jgi:hypothetical protein